MPALTYGKSAIPIVGPTRGSRYRIRRCGRADFSNSELELARVPTERRNDFEIAATSTVATDLCEDKVPAVDWNGRVFLVRFKRRFRIRVIGVDARAVCVLFFAQGKKNLSRSE
jgi:hypothetical protein